MTDEYSNLGVMDTRFRAALLRMAQEGRVRTYTAPATPTSKSHRS